MPRSLLDRVGQIQDESTVWESFSWALDDVDQVIYTYITVMRSSPNIDVHVVPGDGVPIYRQIVRQVSDSVASGRLVPGDRLPSQRELAQRLVVAPLTVKKAYDLLEREGVVESRHGSGTFVAASAGRDEGQARERLDQTVRQLVTQAWVSGFEESDLIALVKVAAARLRNERNESDAAQTTEDKETTT